MSGFHFRKAAMSEAKPLVGLYSESGCGKTKSALLIAKGFAGDMSKVGMIETESGRGEAYADDAEVGGYNVLPLRESFSPKDYGAAISAAERADMKCLIVDSASHEWEGVNGVLAMAAKNQEDGKKGPLVWQKPKIEHAREFMLRLTQTPIPLVIVCMRAKYPMYEVTAAHVRKWEEAGRPGGKPPKPGEWARSWQLDPKQSEDILYEMFIHGWIDKEHNFHGTKYTLDVLRNIFVDGKPITVETGRRLAEWAAGGAKRQESAPRETSDSQAVGLNRDQPPAAADPADEFITPDQCADLEAMCGEFGLSVAALKKAAKVERLAMLKAADFDRALAWLRKHREAA